MTSVAANERDRLIGHYRMVAQTRMDGVPIVNPALSVDAIGFDFMLGEERLGILVTPWFMNAVLTGGPSARAGAKRRVRLPAGWFSFIAHHEEEIGGYWSCSLLSPMFDFADQETAMATAEAALGELLSAGALPGEEERAIADAWSPEASEQDGNPAPDDADAEEMEGAPAQPSRRALLGLS